MTYRFVAGGGATLPDDPHSLNRLTDEARSLIDGILQKADTAPVVGVNRWLLALAETQAPLIENLAGGLAVEELRETLRRRLGKGDEGLPLDLNTLADRALEWAHRRGSARATERDVVSAVLTAAGFFVAGGAVMPSRAPTSAQASGRDPRAESSAPAGAPSPYHPRAARPTPTLDKLGWDLTRAALEGKLRPVVGRDEETQLVIETLCRRTKRNPALVGPAGVGKTAIVEGLAQLIVAGRVPPVLRDSRLISLPVSSLVADTGVVGKLEERMQAVVDEASQDGIILFIDEMHMMKGGGAGSINPGGDVANQLKPALAHGDIACIAATTDEEYRSFIERDPALERRFQPVRVNELSPEETLGILRVLRDDLQKERGVLVSDEVLLWLVDFADRFLKNRFFPDKAVDCLEQCVAHGVARGSTVIGLGDAEAVAKRMVGMPVSPAERLARLSEVLLDSALLSPKDVEALVARLGVTMRGFDLNQERPNAVVVLTGEAASRAGAVAETIAGALYGSPERVVDIDFGRFTDSYDVSMLVGAPPGYIGYDDSLPLHRVAQMPWCVVLCRNVHACHPRVRDVLTQGLEQGALTESRGRRVYLSDALVLMTAPIDSSDEPRQTLGFLPHTDSSPPQAQGGARPPARGSGDDPEVRRSLERVLGRRLMAQVDLVFAAVPSSAEGRLRWLESHVLAGLGERCRRRGINLSYDRTFVEWLAGQAETAAGARDLERLVDERVSPLLIPYLDDPGHGSLALTVRVEDGQVLIEARPPDRKLSADR